MVNIALYDFCLIAWNPFDIESILEVFPPPIEAVPFLFFSPAPQNALILGILYSFDSRFLAFAHQVIRFFICNFNFLVWVRGSGLVSAPARPVSPLQN